MLGWILGLVLLGGGLYLFRPIPAIYTPEMAKRDLNTRAQELLVFFNRNKGITAGTQNIEQNKLVSSFQYAWNLTVTVQISKLRTDGVWDSSTAYAFRQLTGYSPTPVQSQVMSGY